MGSHAGFCVGVALVMLVVMGILTIFYLEQENELLAAEIQKYKYMKKLTDSLLFLTGNFLTWFPVISVFVNPITSIDALVLPHLEEAPEPRRSVPLLGSLTTYRLQMKMHQVLQDEVTYAVRCIVIRGILIIVALVILLYCWIIKREEKEEMEILCIAGQGLLSKFWNKVAVRTSSDPGQTSSNLKDEFREIFDEVSDDFSVWQPEKTSENIEGIPKAASIKYNDDPRLKLGQGISAEVYALNPHHWPHHPPLCIKVFTVTPQSSALKVAMKEARALAELAEVRGFPRLVVLAHDPVSIVMTRHERTLLQVLQSHPRPSKMTVAVTMRELCTVLEYMHDAGFAHNDIKPQNISVKERDLHTTITLLDVGHVCHLGESAYNPRSKHETSIEREYFRRKSFKWLAPEVYSQCQPVTPRGDIYSLGFMLCRLYGFDKKNEI